MGLDFQGCLIDTISSFQIWLKHFAGRDILDIRAVVLKLECAVKGLLNTDVGPFLQGFWLEGRAENLHFFFSFFENIVTFILL